MARFDVYANPAEHGGSARHLPDVQSELLDELDSREERGRITAAIDFPFQGY
jgi:hypothetical protein